MKARRVATFIGVFGLGIFGLSQFASAAEVAAAVASNFKQPIEKIAPLFEKSSGHRLRLSFGSTGKLFSQIHHQAPFDVFLSADREHPAKLIQQGLAEEKSDITYAIGKLVLWSPNPKGVDSSGSILRKGGFNRISLANPKLAPYGLAARQTLEKLGVWEGIRTRAVFGENIGQAFQFVVTGNAELGFVALSQLIHSDRKAKGSHWVVPQEYYSLIRQDAVILKKSKAPTAAREFLKFLQSPRVQALIRESGYELP